MIICDLCVCAFILFFIFARFFIMSNGKKYVLMGVGYNLSICEGFTHLFSIFTTSLKYPLSLSKKGKNVNLCACKHKCLQFGYVQIILRSSFEFASNNIFRRHLDDTLAEYKSHLVLE